MPRYTMRRRDTGEVAEMSLSWAEFDAARTNRDGVFVIDAVEYEHLIREDHKGGRGIGTPPSNWPMYSDALAVHPVDIPAARAHSEKVGTPLDFLPDGRAILTSRGQRRAVLRSHGMHDCDGGYSD